jgi:aspartyl protease family protein
MKSSRRRAVATLAGVLALPWAALPALAQNVQLSGTLGANKAVLVIDGQMQTVAVGATVRGVTLRSLSADEAVVLVDGKPLSLRLGASPVSLAGRGGDGAASGSIVLPVGPGGHFMANGTINGKSANFMVDTGATMISMSVADAERLGLKYNGGRRGMAATAGGSVPVYEVSLNSVRIGNVEVFNLTAGVVAADMPFILLGNNYLSRFNMRREGDTMRLDKKP